MRRAVRATILVSMLVLGVMILPSLVIAQSTEGCPAIDGTAVITAQGTLSVQLDATEFRDCSMNRVGQVGHVILWSVAIAGISHSGEGTNFQRTISNYDAGQHPSVTATVTFVPDATSGTHSDEVTTTFTVDLPGCELYTQESTCVSSGCEWSQSGTQRFTGNACSEGMWCGDVTHDLCPEGSTSVTSGPWDSCRCYDDEQVGWPSNPDNHWNVRLTSSLEWEVCTVGVCTEPDPVCPANRQIDGQCCQEGVYVAEEVSDHTRVCYDGTMYLEEDGIVTIADMEVVLANGLVNVCGQIGPVDEGAESLFEAHDLCEEIPSVSATFVCSIMSEDDETAYAWNAQPSHYDSSSPEWEFLEENNLIPSSLQDASVVMCSDGSLIGARVKYSPPYSTGPQFTEGFCQPEQCLGIFTNDDGSSICIDADSEDSYITAPQWGGFTCTLINDEGLWVSNVAQLAEYTSRYSTTQSVMNCARADFTANRRGQYSYCQLARLSGVNADRILMSVYVPPSNPQAVVDEALDEIRRQGVTVAEGISYENAQTIRGLSRVQTYDPQYFGEGRGGVLSFYIGQPRTGPLGTFFDWITSIFNRTQRTEFDIVTTSGIQYHTIIRDGQLTQHAVEFIRVEEGRFEQVIVTQDSIIPYTESAWRRIIQDR